MVLMANPDETWQSPGESDPPVPLEFSRSQEEDSFDARPASTRTFFRFFIFCSRLSKIKNSSGYREKMFDVKLK